MEPDDEGVRQLLAEEIRLSLDFHFAQPNALPGDELVLSGPGATTSWLPTSRRRADWPRVSVGGPLGRSAPRHRSRWDDPFRYTVAAGLAWGLRQL